VVTREKREHTKSGCVARWRRRKRQLVHKVKYKIGITKTTEVRYELNCQLATKGKGGNAGEHRPQREWWEEVVKKLWR